MTAVISNFQIFRALIIRDLMVRFGRHSLGFVWTIVEPMILCTGVMVIWSFIHEPIIHGIPIIAFIFTGYMPLTLWRHLTNTMGRILRSNVNLLYHRRVSHVHLILTRSILEFLSTTAAIAVIYFVLTSTGIIKPIVDYGLVLAGWLYVAWYFGSMGVLIGAMTEVWEPSEKFIQPFAYLQLPISGTFLMVDWLPDYAQRLILLNPSVHCFEMFRGGFFGPSIATHYDVWYITAWSAFLSFVAAAALYRVRDRIQLT
jgi:capsular polysaccharide transport system permease protein